MNRKNYGMLYKILLCTAMTLLTTQNIVGANKSNKEHDIIGTGNPYLPLWEHLPDGEPRVFEDPDNPGKYRISVHTMFVSLATVGQIFACGRLL